MMLLLGICSFQTTDPRGGALLWLMDFHIIPRGRERNYLRHSKYLFLLFFNISGTHCRAVRKSGKSFSLWVTKINLWVGWSFSWERDEWGILLLNRFTSVWGCHRVRKRPKWEIKKCVVGGNMWQRVLWHFIRIISFRSWWWESWYLLQYSISM